MSAQARCSEDGAWEDEDSARWDAVTAGEGSSVEDAVLARCDVRRALRRLPARDRVIVALMQRYAAPPGYHGPWPPTARHVGEYLGVAFGEFGRRPVPARTVAHLNTQALGRLARWLTPRGGVR